MPSNLNLDYYYGNEAEQYSFYRVPKTLLTDHRFKGVSIEAKVLYDVTVVPVGARSGERQPYTMLSFDNEARQAIDRHEAEYGADGTRVFRDIEAEVGATETMQMTAALGDKTTVRELYEHYVPIIKDKVLADVAYQNACRNSDRETAYLEGSEAVKRAALTMTEDTPIK